MTDDYWLPDRGERSTPSRSEEQTARIPTAGAPNDPIHAPSADTSFAAGPYAQQPPPGQETQPTSREDFGPPTAANPGYQQQHPAQGAHAPQGQQQARTQSAVGAVQVTTSKVAEQVRSMPWQVRAMRLPGLLALVAGLFTLISLLTKWVLLRVADQGVSIALTISPFRGVSGVGGNRFTEAAALNELGSDAVESLAWLSRIVGGLTVIALVLILVAGYLILRGKRPLIGPPLLVAGTLVLVYARLLVRSALEMSDAFQEITQSAIGTLSATDRVLMELAGVSLDFPEIEVLSRAGFSLTTVAVWLLALAIVIYFAMIIYREIVRMKRWEQ